MPLGGTSVGFAGPLREAAVRDASEQGQSLLHGEVQFLLGLFILEATSCQEEPRQTVYGLVYRAVFLIPAFPGS